MDVVFVGSYFPLDFSILDTAFKKQFYEYILSHSSETFEEALLKLGTDPSQLIDTLNTLKPIFHLIRNYYRKKIVNIITASGIRLHVFGSTWSAFGEKENLCIHPDISVEESLEVFSRAKISLNIMSWHKDGFTERMANAMLNKALCLTEDSPYIRENLSDCIATYRLDALEELPALINSYLNDDELLSKTVSTAFIKASKNYTWTVLANRLIEIKKDND